MRQLQISQKSAPYPNESLSDGVLDLWSVTNKVLKRHNIDIVDGYECCLSIEIGVEGDILSILKEFDWQKGNEDENYHEIIIFIDENIEMRYFIDKDELTTLRRENDRRVDTQTTTQI